MNFLANPIVPSGLYDCLKEKPSNQSFQARIIHTLLLLVPMVSASPGHLLSIQKVSQNGNSEGTEGATGHGKKKADGIQPGVGGGFHVDQACK